jgi:hypothetical protein
MAKSAPKIRLVTPEKTHPAARPAGFEGSGRAQAYLDAPLDPIHLHRHALAPGERLAIGPMAADCVAYVWQGAVSAGGEALAAGSSAVVEHGERLVVEGTEREAVVLTFAAAAPAAHGRAGGHVHLLPASRVPRAAELSGSTGVGGGMHSDGSCPTCEVWLHENHFAPGIEIGREQAEKGIHSHSEDEVIFITSGAIRLGARLFPAGTAVAIAADTLYHIAPGPEGMSFINFRAGTPSDIRFASGQTMSETQYWIDRLPRPEYIEAHAA